MSTVTRMSATMPNDGPTIDVRVDEHADTVSLVIGYGAFDEVVLTWLTSDPANTADTVMRCLAEATRRDCRPPKDADQ